MDDGTLANACRARASHEKTITGSWIPESNPETPQSILEMPSATPEKFRPWFFFPRRLHGSQSSIHCARSLSAWTPLARPAAPEFRTSPARERGWIAGECHFVAGFRPRVCSAHACHLGSRLAVAARCRIRSASARSHSRLAHANPGASSLLPMPLPGPQACS